MPRSAVIDLIFAAIGPHVAFPQSRGKVCSRLQHVNADVELDAEIALGTSALQE